MTRFALLLVVSLVPVRASAAGAPEPAATAGDAREAGAKAEKPGAKAEEADATAEEAGAKADTSGRVAPAASSPAIVPVLPQATLEPRAPACATAPLPASPGDQPPALLRRWWLWVAVGAGVAAVAGGTWFALARDRHPGGVSLRAYW